MGLADEKEKRKVVCKKGVLSFTRNQNPFLIIHFFRDFYELPGELFQHYIHLIVSIIRTTMYLLIIYVPNQTNIITLYRRRTIFEKRVKTSEKRGRPVEIKLQPFVSGTLESNKFWTFKMKEFHIRINLNSPSDHITFLLSETSNCTLTQDRDSESSMHSNASKELESHRVHEVNILPVLLERGVRKDS